MFVKSKLASHLILESIAVSVALWSWFYVNGLTVEEKSMFENYHEWNREASSVGWLQELDDADDTVD